VVRAKRETPIIRRMRDAQSTTDVLMIRPVRFVANEQTAASNHFQVVDAAADPRSVQHAAAAEFDALVAALGRAGISVHAFDDTPEPHTPDSLFPNNWISFHADGSAVLYPMLAENRRTERRMDLLESLSTQGFHIARTIDLTHREAQQQFLEGTGSLVLDRANRIAYACLSPRTDMDVLGDFAQRLDYEVAAFAAVDANGLPIYHTNVLMSVGTRFAAVCVDCIEPSRRDVIVRMLETTGHEVIALSYGQMEAFAGNMLELQTPRSLIVAMSEAAQTSLSPEQRGRIEAASGPIVSAAIPTIERHGGGSVRCMLAEIHLPKK
jgi:hypothetical protein